MSENDDNAIYKVLVNNEEQYCIWLDYLAVPKGWREAGKSGPKKDCLEYVKTVWTDMRPLSLRKKMDASMPSA